MTYRDLTLLFTCIERAIVCTDLDGGAVRAAVALATGRTRHRTLRASHPG